MYLRLQLQPPAADGPSLLKSNTEHQIHKREVNGGVLAEQGNLVRNTWKQTYLFVQVKSWLHVSQKKPGGVCVSPELLGSAYGGNHGDVSLWVCSLHTHHNRSSEIKSELSCWVFGLFGFLMGVLCYLFKVFYWSYTSEDSAHSCQTAETQQDWRTG